MYFYSGNGSLYIFTGGTLLIPHGLAILKAGFHERDGNTDLCGLSAAGPKPK
jgi:hypothetical protein